MKKITIRFEDIDTYDIDEITIEGYNFREISNAIKELLTKKGVIVYEKNHKWRIKNEQTT